jgi:hypothetical protein
MAPREIAIATKYDKKFTEFERHFTAYGIRSIQLKTWDVREFKRWLKESPKQHIAVLQEHTDLLAAADRSLIIDAGESPELHLTRVIHKSALKVWTLTPEQHLTYKDYEHDTTGFLSFANQYPVDKKPDDCYDWDDIFIIPATNMSIYATTKLLGHKVSSRDKNIAEFIQDRMYYKQLCNLAFDPVDMKQPVDFTVDPLATLALILPDFHAIYKNPPSAEPQITIRSLKDSVKYAEAIAEYDWYKDFYERRMKTWEGVFENNYYPDSPKHPATSSDPIKCFLHNIVIKCLNTGVFLRAPENRREKLYWVPGLNSGLPLTKKAEQGHERIYRFHDCSHHGIPDLVFVSPSYVNGTIDKPVDAKMHKATYVLHRLMTEAFSLVTGDMLGTNYLQTEHGQYDTAYKRRIIQVYQTLPEWFRLVDNLKDLYYLVYQLVFYGKSTEELSTARGFSDGAKKAILETSEECNSAIAGFLKKYRTYGLDDFYWTMANYDDMLPRAAEFDELFKSSYISRIDDNMYSGSIINNSDTINGMFWTLNENCPFYIPGTETITNTYDLTECIFQDMYAGHVKPYVTAGEVCDLFTPAIRVSVGFCRYIYGQSLIFKHFSFLPESEQVFKLINMTLKKYFLDWWIQGGSMKNDKKNTHKDMEHAARQFVAMIPRIRAIYTDYLDLLLSRNLITQDDRDTFKEVYPIFRPVYVDYDQDTFSSRLAMFEEFVRG